MTIMQLLENDPGLREGERYAGILGATPSKGARSPVLWNAAFEAFGRAERMVPMDIVAEKLNPVLEGLAADTNFIGGAVTMPHKETIAAWLGSGRLTPEAEKIGAVNCLFRNAAGELCGTNTDGEAALSVVRETVPDLKGVKALLLGPGGAGKAVAAFLAGAGATLTLVSRTPDAVKEFCGRIGANAISHANVEEVLSDCSLIVNCTPVGFSNGVKGESPLSQSALALVPPDALVFDVIYDPPATPLLELAAQRALKTENGLKMNLLQAVHGFSKAAGISDLGRIESSMMASG